MLLNQSAETKFEPVEVKKGDAIDFVVDFRGDLNSDQFKWSPTIKVSDKPKEKEKSEALVVEWNAKKDFSGPPPTPPTPLEAWGKYAQVLMLSNEFIFVD